MKRTIIIFVLLAVAVGLGYAYEQVSIALQKRAHPLPPELEGFVMKYSQEYSVPPEIILSVIKAESSFRITVVSNRGAIGLMQIMPGTFDDLMKWKGETHEHGMLYDPETNIRYGTFFLNYLYRRFGNWEIVFAAYHTGQNRDWLNNPEMGVVSDGKLNISAIPSDVTRNYVINVNRNMEMYRKLYFS
jgi:soluble lytic murein transglycosylase